MSHPFDDFLPQEWHDQKRDRRVFRYGMILVALVVTTTFSAFTSTMSSWRSVFEDQQTVSTRWEDARERVKEYLRADQTLKDAIEQSRSIDSIVDSTPKSILLYEMTSLLPSEMLFDAIRIDRRSRPNEEGVQKIVNLIHVSGVAPNDATVSTYVESLKNSSKFTNVALQYSQQKLQGETRNFAITMEVKNVLHSVIAEAMP
ncbi:MAG: PilN domain-containing protein [Phycisphaerales bacterium]|nr:PilN domain-containing protein [Phycisphaerales bacterium]